MRIYILISLLLYLTVNQAKSYWVQGVDYYSTQTGVNTYEFHIEVISTYAPANVVRMNFTGIDFDDSLIYPDTSYLFGLNSYTTNFKFSYTFPSYGTHKISYELISGWQPDVINLMDAVNQRPSDTIIIVNSSTLGNNQFGGFDFDLRSGTVTGTSYSHNISVNEIDGDSISIQQITVSNMSVPVIYQFPDPPVFSTSQGLIGFLYECNNMLIPGIYVVSFEISEYRSGILIATHNRAFTFQYGTLGINDFEYKTGFSIYPNPTSSQITILGEHANFFISDISGKQITELKSNQQNDISFLGSGVYFVIDQHGNSKKLIKL